MRRDTLIALAFFVAGIAAGWRQDPVHKPFTFDNQIYLYAAVRVADGEPPHVSLVDHKHQLAQIIGGAAIRIGRMLGIDDVWSLRAVSIAFAGLTTAAAAGLATAVFGWRAGVLAGLAMLCFSAYFHQAAMGARPKVFMASFAVLAPWAFARARYAVSGALSAAAFLCWQPAALIGAALGTTTLLFVPPRFARSVRLALGGASVIALYELYFLVYNALTEQIRQSYLLPADVSSYPFPKLADSLRFFIRFGTGWREDSSKWIAILALAALAGIASWALVRPGSALRRARERPDVVAVLLCSALAVALTLATHQAYPDMFFVDPFVSVLAAMTIASAATWLARVAPVAWLENLAVVLAAGWLLWLQDARTNVFAAHGLRLADQRELARQTDILYDDAGSVWAVGCPHILALAHRTNFLPYGLLIDTKVRAYVQARSHGRAFVPLRDGRLPGAILASRGGLRHVVPWLTREYSQIPNTSFNRQGIQIWIRREPRPGEPRRAGRVRPTLAPPARTRVRSAQ